MRGATPDSAPTYGHTTVGALKAHFLAVRSQPNPPTWRALGELYGVDHAVLWRITNDEYEPGDPNIRHALGLPVLQVDGIVGACRQCGGEFLPNHPNRRYCYECRPRRG